MDTPIDTSTPQQKATSKKKTGWNKAIFLACAVMVALSGWFTFLWMASNDTAEKKVDNAIALVRIEFLQKNDSLGNIIKIKEKQTVSFEKQQQENEKKIEELTKKRNELLASKINFESQYKVEKASKEKYVRENEALKEKVIKDSLKMDELNSIIDKHVGEKNEVVKQRDEANMIKTQLENKLNSYNQAILDNLEAVKYEALGDDETGIFSSKKKRLEYYKKAEFYSTKAINAGLDFLKINHKKLLDKIDEVQKKIQK